MTYVSWFDAARYCNWEHNECPTGVQDASTTERGAYTLDGANEGGLDITRNPGAKYWIPSEDEWYKAAYHDPRLASRGRTSGGRLLLAVFDDERHGARERHRPASFGESANYIDGSGYSVTQSGIEDPNQNYLTDGGSYEGSAGPYGTFDQGGNVWEWNDAVISGSFRGLRGGSWFNDEFNLRSSLRNINDPDDEERQHRVSRRKSLNPISFYSFTLWNLAGGGRIFFEFEDDLCLSRRSCYRRTGGRPW